MVIEQPWERIVPIHDIPKERLIGFGCGVSAFDQWLLTSARSAASRGECVAHICMDSAGLPVAFFTLSATSISPDDVSNKFRGGLHGLIPATLLGKMGVRTDVQGNGCGTRVLHHAMQYALRSAQFVSSRLLVVDALTVDLVPWYENRGFRRLPNTGRRLVCKMSDVREICSQQTPGYFTE